MTTYRDVWLEALGGLIAFADELKAKTEAEFAGSARGTPKWATLLIGLRGRRVLQAVHVLAPHQWDDVIGNLSRALVEAAIDLDYLHTDSPLGEGEQARTLTPDMKAELFATQVYILEKKLGKKMRLGHDEEHERARALHREYDASVGHTWHGRTTAGILKELSDGEKGKGRLKNIEWAFRANSYFEQNNPIEDFYLERSPRGGVWIREQCPHSWPLSSSVLAGAEICYKWGAVLGLSEEELYGRLAPVERAGKADPDAFSKDA